MKKTIFSLFFLFSLFFGNAVSAQDITTEGTEFWVSFLGNGYKDRYSNDYFDPHLEFTWLKTQLIISAKRQCNVTVRNPNSGYMEQFQVAANSTYPLDIPIEEAYMELNEYGQALGKGLLITADDTISAYCANIAEMSFDASYVLPVQALADDYIIQTHDQSTETAPAYRYNHSSAFVIIATEDGETTIDITPSVTTYDGKPAHQEYSITLQKGQSYQVRSHVSSSGGSRDLSGTRVTARDCKKIAVFNGNNLTRVPDSGSDADMVFEQAMPLQAWGKQFVVTSSLGRQRNDYVKITSAYDDNVILRNGQPFATLNANESRIFELSLSSKSCYIEASRSCAVYLYNHSTDGNSMDAGPGAPSMVWIAPIEQRISELTFSTFNYVSEHETDIDNHYVNIIVESKDVGNVVLDGNLIDEAQFEAVNGTDEYKFHRRAISDGTHNLSCPNGFNAHIYGFGDARGYAYMVGSKAADLTSSIIIDGIEVADGDTIADCALEPIVFQASVNYGNYSVDWDFGDGQSSHEETVQHTYGSNAIYTATFTIHSGETTCQEATVQTHTFYLDTRRDEDEEYSDDACIGSLYNNHGFSDVPITGDTILSREIESDLPAACKGHVIVHVTAHETGYNGPYEEQICFTGPGVFEKYGISIPFDQPGTYDTIAALPSEFGCESLTELHLTVGFVNDHEPDIVSECHSYTWQNGITYYESQNVDDTIPDPETGCYEIRHLQLSIKQEPDSCHVHPIGYTTAPWVVPGNEFQINAYTFTVSDSIQTDYNQYDSVAWQLCKRDVATGQLVESGLNWRLAVSGAKCDTCKVYPFNHTNDTVWLRATAFNGCSEEGVRHDYWMVCSFYGMEEDQATNTRFSIVPNPNNGHMELRFDHLIGMAEIRIYDMHGILIEQIQGRGGTIPCDLSHQPAGIYFFVVSTQDGSAAKKVVVTK